MPRSAKYGLRPDAARLGKSVWLVFPGDSSKADNDGLGGIGTGLCGTEA